MAAQTHSDRATAWARELTPLPDFAAASIAIQETAEMRSLLSERFSLQRVLEVRDAVEAARRNAAVAPLDLRAVANAAAASAAAVRRIRDSDAERLRARCDGFVPLAHVSTRIDDAIGERGDVLDRASPALARLRRGIVAAGAEARERTTAIARSQRYRSMLQDDVVTVREGRYVVPVKAEFAGEFKGIVHDSSASGQTYFVEPLEALEANNRLRGLRAQEEHEVARILSELSALVGANADALERDVEIYAQLDLIYAKARLAEDMKCVAPELVDAGVLQIAEGRHPLLDQRAVAQSLRLDDEIRMLLISGPNMGGKTVTLKMVGLFVLMTYAGMHLPAAPGTAVGRFERLFADIGDEQSIAQNASTFSQHLRRYAEILSGAGPRALILIDEIGGGTEPNAGAALAVALLERFLTSGARTIATTHAGELKLFGHSQPHVSNASVRFDPATYAPTYQLEIGAPGQSLALPLARAMQIEPAVVDRAESILSSSERDYERALAELATLQAQTAAQRDALAAERKQLEKVEAEAERRRHEYEEERRGFARAAEGRLTDTLRDFVRDLERRSSERRRPKVTPGQSAALSRAIGDLHRDLGLDRTNRAGEAPASLVPGDRVIVGTLEQEGNIVAIDDAAGEAVVQIGPMRMTVKRKDLRPAGRVAQKSERTSSPAAEIAARTMPEIDVRGKRLVEAEPLVEQWLDEATLLGYSPLRLIHGKGTGLLGKGLQEYLKMHPNVRSFRYGNENEGGSGVTIVELRS